MWGKVFLILCRGAYAGHGPTHNLFCPRRKTHQPFSAVKPPSSALQGVKPPSSTKHADCCKLNQYHDASFKQVPLFCSSLLIAIHAPLTPKGRKDWSMNSNRHLERLHRIFISFLELILCGPCLIILQTTGAISDATSSMSACCLLVSLSGKHSLHFFLMVSICWKPAHLR